MAVSTLKPLLTSIRVTTFRIDGTSSVTKIHFAAGSSSGLNDNEEQGIVTPGRSNDKCGRNNLLLVATAGIEGVGTMGVSCDSGIAGLQELMGTSGRRIGASGTSELFNDDDSKESNDSKECRRRGDVVDD